MYGRGLVSVPVSVFAWYFFTRVNSAKTGRLISKIQKFRMRSLSLIESEKSRHTMNDTNSTYRLKQNESAKITRFVGPQYCTLIPYKRQDTTGCSIISWMFSTTRIFCGNIIRYYRYPFGIVAAIPILATAQGAYCLTKFRWNHKNAPYPMSPSRGIVIVSPHDTGSNVSICMDNAHDKDLARKFIKDKEAKGKGKDDYPKGKGTNKDKSKLLAILDKDDPKGKGKNKARTRTKVRIRERIR